MEVVTTPVFLEKRLSGNEPPRCVDGRPSDDSEQGPQMLGGSINVILLECIYNGRSLNEQNAVDDIENLHEMEFNTGAHRGQHAHGEASDCGFADRMRDILRVAVEKRDLITKHLLSIYDQNKESFPPLPFNELMEKAYEKIEAYSPDEIKIKGEELVALVEKTDSKVETVRDDHTEEAAFVNLVEGTTLDTSGLNQEGTQVFNLDIFEVAKHAKASGVPEDFSIPASLILYAATEIVLVEDKGKPALPVEIHF